MSTRAEALHAEASACIALEMPVTPRPRVLLLPPANVDRTTAAAMLEAMSARYRSRGFVVDALPLERTGAWPYLVGTPKAVYAAAARRLALLYDVAGNLKT